MNDEMVEKSGLGLKTLTAEKVKDSDALERYGILEIVAVHGLGGDREGSWSSARKDKASESLLVRESRRHSNAAREEEDSNNTHDESPPPHRSAESSRDRSLFNSDDESYPSESRQSSRSPLFPKVNSAGNSEPKSRPSPENNVLWLRDYLPTYIPQSRVSLFGYALDNEGISTTDIVQKAKELLDTLVKPINEDDGRRTFVFIGHDLGGLIIKQALAIANTEAAYFDIAKATSLLLFFGTPQRAEDQAGWERLAHNIILATGQENQRPLSDILRASSSALKDVNEIYSSLARTYNAISICETISFPSQSHLVVDRYAATMGIPNELVISQNSNHHDLCQGLSDDDKVFHRICDRMMTASAPDPKYLEALRQYSLLDATTRILASVRFSSLQPRWILEHETFVSFLKQTKRTEQSASVKRLGILQIYGKPGSGLSVLSSFISTLFKQHSRPGSKITEKVLESIPKNLIAVTFRFDSRDYRTCSTSALFASLTRQLLEADPDNFKYIRRVYELVTKMSIPWTLENLWMLFRSIISRPDIGPVYCFVDAINKCDPERNYFLSEFLQLSRSIDEPLKIILTNSGGDPDKFASDLQIDVDAQANRKTDLEGFVDHEILRLIKTRPVFQESIAIIREKVLALKPTFLVAMLAFKYLHDSEARSTPSGIQVAFDELPQSLANIYQQGYIKNKAASSRWNWNALFWISHALRPLKVEELATALAIEYKDGIFTISESNRPRYLAEDLKRAFGSFITINDDEVFLVHESAREYLLKSLQECDPDSLNQSPFGHARISSLCLDYLLNASWEEPALSTDEKILYSPPPLKGASSLFPYAARYWYIHCNLAGENKELLEKVCLFLENKERRKLWSKAEWYEGKKLLAQRDTSNPLLVASQLDLSEVLLSMIGEDLTNVVLESTVPEIAAGRGNLSLLTKLQEKGIHVERSLALRHAAQNGHLDVVKFLLEHGAEIDQVGGGFGTALHAASQNGYLDVVVELLDRDKGADIKVQFEEMSTLHFAARFGNTEICRKLIENNAELNTRDERGSTALHLATASGQLKTMELLIESGAALDMVSYDSLCPLHIAAQNGFSDAIKLLVLKGAPLNETDSLSYTPLHFAVEVGSEECVRELYEADADINISADGVGAPLNIAAKTGNIEIVELLLDGGAEIGLVDDSSNTALHLAARYGHTSIMKLLLDHGFDPDTINEDGQTALHLAASNGNFGVVKLLIAHKTQLNILDENNYTPIVAAARRGDLPIVTALIKAGAELVPADQASSALQEAARAGHVDIMIELLQGGLSPDGESRVGASPLHLAAKSGNIEAVRLLLKADAFIDAVDSDNERTPLLEAAALGYLAIVKLLLDNDAETDVTDTEGSTFLHCAAMGNNLEVLNLSLDERNNPGLLKEDHHDQIPLHVAAKNGLVTVATRLLDIEGFSEQVEAENDRERIPLHLAAKSGSVETVKLLLEKGSDLEAIEAKELTALHLATKKQHVELVEFLIEKGADANKVDNRGRSPLFIACEKDNQKLIDILLPKSKNLEIVNAQKNTLLHILSSRGNLETVKYLLQKGLDVNAFNDNHCTPISNAVRSENLDMVQVLLEAGADLNNVDSEKKSPLTWAVRANKLDLVTALLNAGAKADLEECRWSPVYTAAYYGRTRLMEDFLKRKFDVDWKGPDDWTPLHGCYDSAPMTELLIDASAKMDLVNADNETSFDLCIKYGYTDTVEKYLEKGVDPLQRNSSNGTTPLHVAARRRNMKILTSLLKAVQGKDIDIEDNDGWTPLECAFNNSNIEAMKLLLDQGKCDKNRRSSRGHNLLQLAMDKYNVEAIELLIDKGVELEPAMCDKLMDVVVERGSVSLTQILIDRGVNTRKTDEHGWTFELLAKATGNTAVAGLLESIRGNARLSPDIKQPSGWSTTKKSDCLVVEDDNLTVTDGRGEDKQRIANVHGDHPVSILDKTFYFEIEVLSVGSAEIVGIGLTKAEMSLSRMPGWDSLSWGYHGDDGKKYNDDSWGRKYAGVTFTKGDTIGCFLDIEKKEMSYTKNGTNLGVAFDNVHGRLFPVVGLGIGASIKANFGFGKIPFKWIEPGKERENSRGSDRRRERVRDRDSYYERDDDRDVRRERRRDDRDRSRSRTIYRTRTRDF